jgi:hypothetical protein
MFAVRLLEGAVVPIASTVASVLSNMSYLIQMCFRGMLEKTIFVELSRGLLCVDEAVYPPWSPAYRR